LAGVTRHASGKRGRSRPKGSEWNGFFGMSRNSSMQILVSFPRPTSSMAAEGRMRTLTGAKLLGTTTVDTRDAMLAVATDIYE
jgi:hypothetical protein